jgi:prepilin-type N-terminal cleavage/methylation domain-containing protein
MKSIKRKGFTLVELLIVIVVIGILSAMMMLSSTEAVTSARASNIVSNLRNFKTAAMAMYVDYYDNMDKGTNPKDGTAWTDANTDTKAILVKYMNKGDSNATDTDINNYSIVVGTAPNGGNGYYVKCSNVSDTRVQEKLAGRAASVGLLMDVSSSSNGTTYSATSGTDKTSVYMFVTQYGSATNTTNQ